MELCLRSALCLCLFLSCFQAMPFRKNFFKDLAAVKCQPDARFTSPTGVQAGCFQAACNKTVEQLKLANSTCTEQNHLIDQAVKIFRHMENSSTPSNASTCTWEDESSQKEFTDFVDDIKSLAQNIENYKSEQHGRRAHSP